MNKLKTLIRRMPGAKQLYGFLKTTYQDQEDAAAPFPPTYPSGHFYSPIPDLKEVLAREKTIFQEGLQECLGIDLRKQAQLNLLDQFALYYNELSFPEHAEPGKRYYYQNDYFSYPDAIVLYSVLRHFQPKQVIEIGSGFSSAVMLDTNDKFLSNQTQFTFIEPYPERLYNLLSERDKHQHQVIENLVQKVDLAIFDRLESGDILFVDSSHIVKVGSDVAHILFEILPRLKPGVIIHFHDIFWAFEYPKAWLVEGRAWNEAYCLRAFLQYNATFQILYFNALIGSLYSDELEQKMPLCLRNTGGSLWLQKSLV